MGPLAALFFSIALCAFADDTLYNDLKADSPPQAQQPNTFFLDDNLSHGLRRYGMLEGLKEPFQRPDEGKDYLPVCINVNEELPYRYRSVIEDTVYLQLLLIASVGVLAALPEGITNWNRDKLREQPLSERWFKHVSSKPVWDNDDWSINYIGHPVAGAFYYTMARNDGMSIAESVVFSALMSTFIWEYGYEAVAETPSIQDLIITPLIGSLLGEGMVVLERKLDEQGGVVFGSKVMGDISYFLLDPLGNIADGIKVVLRYANLTPDVTMTIRTYPRADGMAPFDFAGLPEETAHPVPGDYGFIITFQ